MYRDIFFYSFILIFACRYVCIYLHTHIYIYTHVPKHNYSYHDVRSLFDMYMILQLYIGRWGHNIGNSIEASTVEAMSRHSTSGQGYLTGRLSFLGSDGGVLYTLLQINVSGEGPLKRLLLYTKLSASFHANFGEGTWCCSSRSGT